MADSACNDENRLICEPCGLELAPRKTYFTYLGHAFNAEMLCCPGCGQVYIPEDLVRGRIHQVETTLEDK